MQYYGDKIEVDGHHNIGKSITIPWPGWTSQAWPMLVKMIFVLVAGTLTQLTTGRLITLRTWCNALTLVLRAEPKQRTARRSSKRRNRPKVTSGHS